MLQASAQLVPGELRVCYGPDTYMGENLVSLLDSVLTSGWSDSRIRRELHPQHDRLLIRSLRDNVVVYPGGNCVVHHMFGTSVADAVEREYPDAYVTAHLEVPGEMFCIALRKSLSDKGVVGSTSDILGFIERKVGEAAVAVAAAASSSRDGDVNRVERAGHTQVSPVRQEGGRSEAVMGVDDDDAAGATTAAALGRVVPGSARGEGCSAAGGCATCPFIKMNDLDTLHDVINMIGRVRLSSASWLSSGWGAAETARCRRTSCACLGTCRRIDSRGCASAGGTPSSSGRS